MHDGKLLALFVVVVLCIAFIASPAMAATPVLCHGATTSPSVLGIGDSKDQNTTSGDDDRWGEPGGGEPEEEIGTGEDINDGEPGGNGKAILPGRPLLRFLFGNWFVL